MNYIEAKAYIERGRNAGYRKIANNTYVVRVWSPAPEHPDYGIKLHATTILVYRSDGSTVFTPRGWYTHTTKERINRFGPPGIYVSQRKGKWYLSRGSANPEHRYEVPFFEGITLDAAGNVLNPQIAQLRMG